MDNLRPTGFATEEEANPTQTATEVSSENPASDAADAVSEEAPQDMASAMADFAAYEESFQSISSPGGSSVSTVKVSWWTWATRPRVWCLSAS